MECWLRFAIMSKSDSCLVDVMYWKMSRKPFTCRKLHVQEKYIVGIGAWCGIHSWLYDDLYLRSTHLWHVSNCIPLTLWHGITYPCPRYLLLSHTSSYDLIPLQRCVLTCAFAWNCLWENRSIQRNMDHVALLWAKLDHIFIHISKFGNTLLCVHYF